MVKHSTFQIRAKKTFTVNRMEKFLLNIDLICTEKRCVYFDTSGKNCVQTIFTVHTGIKLHSTDDVHRHSHTNTLICAD